MRTTKPQKRFHFFKRLGEFSRDQSGLSAIEYALVAALIAGATIVSVGQIGVATSGALMGMNASINGNGANNNSGNSDNSGGSGTSGSAGSGSTSGSGAGGSAGDNSSGGKSGASGGGKGKKKRKKRKKKKK